MVNDALDGKDRALRVRFHWAGYDSDPGGAQWKIDPGVPLMTCAWAIG